MTVLVCGWGLILADMPVYMLLEGRRFWPAPLRALGLAAERQRLARIRKALEERFKDQRVYLEASVEYRHFPLDPQGDPQVLWPTRLGNTIAAFESYPQERYGIDAVFFWPRIWLRLSEETRAVIDGSQALADSAVYGCVSLCLAAAAWLLYALMAASGRSPVAHLPSGLACAAIALGLAAAGYGVYRISVFANAQFGELFKAAVDINANRFGGQSDTIIDVASLVRQIAADSGEASLITSSTRSNLSAVWRYLQNYRIKCPTCGRAIPVPQYAAHRQSRHGD